MVAESVYGFQDLEDDIRDYCVYSEQIDIEFDQEELPVSEEEVHENHPYRRNRIKDLTDRERQDIYEALLEVSNNGKLKKEQHICDCL